MSYSIFFETMADMTFEEIEDAARRKLPVLFPIAVIEEHGPHMCLATDTYLTYNFARDIKRGLSGHDVEAIIAPPYYWGINAAMDGFGGSFRVKLETMEAVLYDLLECLMEWGFEKVFLLSVHGDFEHNLAMTNAARKASEELKVAVYSIVTDLFIRRAKLSGTEPYILRRAVEFGEVSGYLDIHAGSLETSLMADQFPDLVDLDKAKGLGTSRTTTDGLRVWLKGGRMAREVTPRGYLGDPSAVNIESARESNARTVDDLVKVIHTALTKR
jgi:creatinine amidohydrolase